MCGNYFCLDSLTHLCYTSVSLTDTVKRSKRKESYIVDMMYTKETTLERADFTLQLLMFVTAKKEREMFTIFFLSSFCHLLSPRIQAIESVRLSASRPRKLWPTGLEGTSF